jgi:hypothetical protein
VEELALALQSVPAISAKDRVDKGQVLDESTDIGPITSSSKENSSNPREDGFTGKTKHVKKAKDPPSPNRLMKLVALNQAHKEIRLRGGPGRLSFEEFERLLISEQGRGLCFVEGWFELGSF